MGTPITQEQAIAWLANPPVVFFASCTQAEAEAAATDPRLGDWRFESLSPKQVRTLTVERLKELLKKDFADAPAAVKAVGRRAFNESDDQQAMAKLVGVLDEFRDEFSKFTAEEKDWLRAWAEKRGIKRRNED